MSSGSTEPELTQFCSVGQIGDFLILSYKRQLHFAYRESQFQFSNFMSVSAKSETFFIVTLI